MDDRVSAHFKWAEFGCNCGRCRYRKGYQIDLGLVIALEKIRIAYGKPMKINSGIRCPYWNKKEGGKLLSFHLPAQGCMAADISMKDRRGKILIVKMALELGLSVGASYRTFIHLDNRPVQVIF